MKEIHLTQGKVALVDDEDYEWLNQWKWFAHNPTRDLWYACSIINNVPTKMHRLILGLTNPIIDTDHINHNGLDNQRKNIRPCNKSENSKNKRPFGKSKYLGVSLQKKKGYGTESKSWVARIKYNDEYIYLGSFKFRNEIDAARAYDEAAKKYHGEFANLNFK